MAGFKAHITFSTLLGAGYGSAAFFAFDAPWQTCLLAGGLCGVSGMLPDIDSPSSTPKKESMAFAAAVVSMLMLHRFQHWGMSHEMIVLAGAAVYLLVRFGLSAFLKRYSVHRGMFHSLPAVLVFGEIAFLLASGDNQWLRLFKAGAVSIGYLSHLILDEVYSFQWHGGRIRLKNSFGTAIKLFGDTWRGNISAYGKLALLSALIFIDPPASPTATQPGNSPSMQPTAQKLSPQALQQTAERWVEAFRR